MACPDIPFAEKHCTAWEPRREEKSPGSGCGWQIFNGYTSCLWDAEGKALAVAREKAAKAVGGR